MRRQALRKSVLWDFANGDIGENHAEEKVRSYPPLLLINIQNSWYLTSMGAGQTFVVPGFSPIDELGERPK
ncbi:MAG: hypothetical protein AAFV95_19760 [Bacteroidota bacterium]